MPIMLESPWTANQIVLTVLLGGCTLVLLKRLPSPCARSAGASGVVVERAILAVVWALLALFLVARGGDELGIRPDSWSDANVMVSGRNYAREGVWAHCCAAQHQDVSDRNPSDPFFLYVRYPVASNLINGAWQRLGVTSERAFRLLPSGCSLASVWVWLAIFRRFAPARIALTATAVMATSFMFLAYADNLHFHAYAYLTTACGMECYLRGACDATLHRTRWLLLCCVFLFIGALLTWEYHLWSMLFIFTHASLFKLAIPRKWITALMAPLVLALMLQAWQRRCVQSEARMGSTTELQAPPGFLEDFYRRTIGFDQAPDTPAGVTLFTYPMHMAARSYKYFGIPWLAAILLIALALRHRIWTEAECIGEAGGARLLVVLLIAGSGWWLLMMQHSAVHPQVLRHVVPAYAWAAALLIDLSRNAWRSASRWRRIAAGGIFCVLVLIHADGTITNVAMHLWPTFEDPRGRAECGYAEKDLIGPFAGVAPEGAVVLTNYNRPPTLRYWLDRPIYSAWFWPAATRDRNGTPRIQYELAFNHIRELYQDRLPPMCYFYRIMHPTPEEAYRGDPLLRLFLTGRTEPDTTGETTARELLEEAATAGSTNRSYCPIDKFHDGAVFFRIDRVVPRLRDQLREFGFPTLAQCGLMQ